MGIQRKIRRGIRKAEKIPGIQFGLDEDTGKFLPPKRWPKLALLTPAFIAAHLGRGVLGQDVLVTFSFEIPSVDPEFRGPNPFQELATYRLREYNAETRAFIAERV